MAAVYVGSTKWTAVTAWEALTAYSVGDLRRQLATPTVNNERVWRCTTAGTSGAVEPTWTLTAGSTTADATVVWTEVTGLSTYGWTAAHARLFNAFASGWGAAGDLVYVSNAHAETQSGALVLTSPGASASPVRVVCVSDAATPPTARAVTATITVSGANEIQFRGVAYSYGVEYVDARTSGTSFIVGNVSGSMWLFEACRLHLSGSGATVFSLSSTTGTSTEIQLKDVVLKFGSTTARVRARGPLVWRGGSVDAGGTIPAALFDMDNGDPAIVLVEGVNLSALGSGKALVAVAAQSGYFTFVNCKLGSSVAIISGTITHIGGPRVRLINCDSADTQYRFAQALYEGMETSETTVVRTGGATDGTTPMARKVVATAGASIHFPYESLPIEFWNERIGSPITVSIPVISSGVTFTDAELWIEVEYLGTAGFPLGVFASSRVADPIFGTPANVPTDGVSSWAGGLGSPVLQLPSVTFTPEEKGLVRVRVMVAKASATVYYDPKALATSARQYQSVAGYVNEGGPGAQPNIFDSAIIRAVTS